MTAERGRRREVARGAAFRLDVQGLRAVSILLVLGYHAAAPYVPAGYLGVDIFFVISGFLITGMLFREAQETGRVSWVSFYARRARRLLPAAATVLVLASVGIATLTPTPLRAAFGGDVAAAAIFGANWRFAGREVDYAAQGLSPSPVLHFWSLSVEEQFYLLWPILVIVAVALSRRRKSVRRPLLSVILVAVFVSSLAWALAPARGVDASGFFDTRSRLWELALGGVCAVGVPLWRGWGARARSAVQVSACAIIVAAAIVGPPSTGGASWATLAATLAAAGAIAAGGGSSRPDAVLGSRPLVWLGGLSYSLYLWHWPLLTFAHERWGSMPTSANLLIVCAAVAPAWLSYRLIETPVRRSRRLARSWRASWAVGLFSILAAASAGTAVALIYRAPSPQHAVIEVPDPVEPTGVPRHALPTPPTTLAAPGPIADLRPAVAAAYSDHPDEMDKGCQVDVPIETPTWCLGGDLAGAITIDVVGDSTVMQWASVLDAIGADRGWRVRTTTKSSCTFATGYQDRRGTYLPSCTVWNDTVTEQILADPPDFIITSTRSGVAWPSPDAAAPDGATAVADMAARWRALEAAGIQVIVLLDNPTPPIDLDIPTCVAAHSQNYAACSFQRAAAEERGGTIAQEQAARAVPSVDVIDLNDWICNRDVCPPVVGDNLVYRDTHHLTVSFTSSLAEPLALWLDAIVADPSLSHDS